MIRVTADDALLAKDLPSFHDSVEIWDANGKLLGMFVPGNLEYLKRVYAEAIARTDLAELARRAAEPGPRRLHKDILKELEAAYPIAAANGVPATEPAASPESKECAAQ